MRLPPMVSSSKDHVHIFFNDPPERDGGAFRLEWIVNGTTFTEIIPTSRVQKASFPKRNRRLTISSLSLPT